MLELAPLLVSALILGLLGGGHCLGMCGGLMGALTLAIPKEQRSRRFRLLLAYNLGRILSYATAGLLGANAFDANGALQAPADWRAEQFAGPGAPRAAWVGVRMSF